VSSATIHLGAKIAKSHMAIPFLADWLVSTVKIEGSGWSKLIDPTTQNLSKSYR